MFKLTGNTGYRSAGRGGGGAGSRVSTGSAGFKNVGIGVPGPRRVAFLPDTPQESNFDSSTRTSGLESIISHKGSM